jgi:excisionase family DNA binding protein
MALYDKETNKLPRLVDAKTAAAFLGISLGTLYNWVYQGRVPYFKPSRKKLLFDLNELEQLLDMNHYDVTTSGCGGRCA